MHKTWVKTPLKWLCHRSSLEWENQCWVNTACDGDPSSSCSLGRLEESRYLAFSSAIYHLFVLAKKKKAPFVGWNLRSSWKTEVAHTQTWNGCISSPWQADSHCNWQQILHPAHGSAQVHIKSFLRGKLKVSLSNGPCRSSCHCRLAGEPGLLSDHQALWSMLRSTNTIWWADNLSRKAPSESLALLMHSYACLHSLLVSLAYGLTSCAGFDPKISVTNVGWPQW